VKAIVREIPDSFASAISAAPRAHPIDVALARKQPAAYCEELEVIGVAVTRLPADERFPDCVFVEDTAVVAGDVALITRPGADARRGETEAVAAELARHVGLARVAAPATVDGGDCMRLGDTLYIGRSARTNAAGIARVTEVFARRGIDVVALDLPPGVLHLKCVVSPLADGRVLLADGTLPPELFDGKVVSVPADESYAANCVCIADHVILAAEYPRARDAVSAAGFRVHLVPTSEVRKADGSLTCQSIVFV
jgi:dimethylargininase